jgi:hypothetical protein
MKAQCKEYLLKICIGAGSRTCFETISFELCLSYIFGMQDPVAGMTPVFLQLLPAHHYVRLLLNLLQPFPV